MRFLAVSMSRSFEEVKDCIRKRRHHAVNEKGTTVGRDDGCAIKSQVNETRDYTEIEPTNVAGSDVATISLTVKAETERERAREREREGQSSNVAAA
jgi:hypothetical protein